MKTDFFSSSTGITRDLLTGAQHPMQTATEGLDGLVQKLEKPLDLGFEAKDLTA